MTKLFWTVWMYLQAYWVQLVGFFGCFFSVMFILAGLMIYVEKRQTRQLVEHYRKQIEEGK